MISQTTSIPSSFHFFVTSYIYSHFFLWLFFLLSQSSQHVFVLKCGFHAAAAVAAAAYTSVGVESDVITLLTTHSLVSVKVTLRFAEVRL